MTEGIQVTGAGTQEKITEQVTGAHKEQKRR